MEIPAELLEIGDETEKKLGKSNKKQNITEEIEEENLGIRSLLSGPKISRNSIVMFINWIVITLGYYGISMGVGTLGSGLFVSLILLSLVEIPSYLACALLMDHTGRKPLFVLSLLLTGVGCINCIISGFMEDGPGKTTLALVGQS